MKILVLIRNDGEASRFRIVQYLPELHQAKLNLFLLPNAHSSNSETGLARAKAQLRRMFVCLTAKRYQMIWSEGPLRPQLPWFFRPFVPWFLPALRIYDIHNPDWLDAVELQQGSDTWIVTPFASAFSHQRLHSLPWSVRLPQPGQQPDKRRVGCFAQRCAPQRFEAIAASVRSLNPKLKLERVGGNVPMGTKGELPPFRFEAEVKPFQVVLFPLSDQDPGAEERDLLRCMALGIPVLIDADSPLKHLILEANAGWSISQLELWGPKLHELLANPSLCHELGQNGHTWVRLNRERGLIGTRLAIFLSSLIPDTDT